jgi:hypothetical protein
MLERISSCRCHSCWFLPRCFFGFGLDREGHALWAGLVGTIRELCARRRNAPPMARGPAVVYACKIAPTSTHMLERKTLPLPPKIRSVEVHGGGLAPGAVSSRYPPQKSRGGQSDPSRGPVGAGSVASPVVKRVISLARAWPLLVEGSSPSPPPGRAHAPPGRGGGASFNIIDIFYVQRWFAMQSICAYEGTICGAANHEGHFVCTSGLSVTSGATLFSL